MTTGAFYLQTFFIAVIIGAIISFFAGIF